MDVTKPKRVIEIVDYDPAWREEFQSYQQRLHAALGDLAMSIEHVGSTSVAGLAAKPIVDIDIVISSRIMLPRVIDCLATIGYRHKGQAGIPGREAFHWAGEKRHHLYVCSADAPSLHNHLIFRDYLRAFPESVIAYGELKHELARQYRHDIDNYIEGKSQFIQETLAKAEAAFGYHRRLPFP